MSSFFKNKANGLDGKTDAKDLKITPSGNISATNVEDAIKELDQRTAATGAKLYVQTSEPISDLTGLWIDTSS